MQFYSFNSYLAQSLLRVEREIVELIDRNSEGSENYGDFHRAIALGSFFWSNYGSRDFSEELKELS